MRLTELSEKQRHAITCRKRVRWLTEHLGECEDGYHWREPALSQQTTEVQHDTTHISNDGRRQNPSEG